MRRFLAVAIAALACAGSAGAATFTVLPGDVPLPSAQVGNAPGDIVMPAAILTPPAQIPVIRYGDLLSLWRHAGEAYGVPWEVLAAINEIESGFGRDMGPSSANAVGWMQFLPSTWEDWGVDANADGIADPWNPTDSVYAAARYLAATGAHEDLSRAVFAYNHAQWYVDKVLALAADYLANPLRGQLLLYAPPGAEMPSNDALEAKLADARERLTALGAEVADLRAQLEQVGGRLAEAEAASGDPSLSRRAFRAARARIEEIETGRMLLEAEVASSEAALVDATQDVVMLEQGLAEQRASVLTGGVQGLIGRPPTANAARVIDYAIRQLGIPYQWGGNHGFSLEQMVAIDPAIENGFDCSSLLSWAFAKGAGIYIGDYTGTQWEYGVTVPGAIRGFGPAQGGGMPPGGYSPGDLIFFNDTDHVALYLGNDLFIHAPHTGDVVRVARLSQYPSQVWGWVRYEAVSGVAVDGSGAFTDTTQRLFDVVDTSGATDPGVITFTRG